ncbi:MAG TPA: hypothetical protein VGC85_08650, partial [Chthoniobacterales bacterium]
MQWARIWLEYVLARGALALFALLPRATAIDVAMQISRALLRFFPKLQRIGLRNLQIAFPDLSAGEREDLLTRSVENLGRVFGELSHLRDDTPESLAARIDFSGAPETLARYRAERAEKRPIIFVTPHLGNWEILVLAVSALIEPIAYLARPLDNPLLDATTTRIRTRFGNRAISKHDSVMEGLEVLDHGGVLGMLADVNTLMRDGVFVPFFGRPACTTRAVAMLAMRTNALILPICGVWHKETQRYVAIPGEFIEVARTGKRRDDIVETTAR